MARSISLAPQKVDVRKKAAVQLAADSTEDLHSKPLQAKQKILNALQAFKDDPMMQKVSLDQISQSVYEAILSDLKDVLHSIVKISYNSLFLSMIVEFWASACHEIGQMWLSHHVSQNVQLEKVWPNVTVGGNVDHKDFLGPYSGSSKAPDACVFVKGRYWPTLVMEVGWSQDYQSLIQDAKMWLLGSRDGSGNQNVNLVLLVNMNEEKAHEPAKISCSLELWEADDTSNIRKRWERDYPTVDISCEDVINIPFSLLLGVEFCSCHGFGVNEVLVLPVSDLFNLIEDGMWRHKKDKDAAKAISAQKRKREEEEAQQVTD